MATIEKRSNGSYRIKVYVGTDLNGKAIFKSKTVKPMATSPQKIKRELNTLACEFEQEIKTGKSFDGEKLTFAEFYEKWFMQCADKLSPAEREANRANIKRVFFPEIGMLPMSAITPLHIQSIIKKLEKEGKSAKTVRKYFSELSPIFKKAFQWRIIESNPCATGLIEFQKTAKQQSVKTFTESEARRFLAFCKAGTIDIHVEERKRKNGRVIPAHYESYQIPFQIYLLFMLAFHCGMRRGELLACRWSDIDLKACVIHVRHSASYAKEAGGRFIKSTKTSSGERDVPIPSKLVPLFKQWKTEQQERMRSLGSAWQGETKIETQFLFIQDNGKGMNIYTPTKWFQKALRLYNLTSKESDRLPETVTLHGLRHCYGSVLLSNGVPIATVSALMGHASVSITMEIYVHDVKDLDETRELVESIFQDMDTEEEKAPVLLG